MGLLRNVLSDLKGMVCARPAGDTLADLRDRVSRLWQKCPLCKSGTDTRTPKAPERTVTPTRPEETAEEAPQEEPEGHPSGYDPNGPYPSIWEKGRDACLEGKDISEAPYPGDTPQSQRAIDVWQEGWKAAAAEKND